MSIDQFLSTTGAKWLYHFTDLENLPSIREHGLLPLRELRSRGIRPPKPGGNQLSHNLDEHHGLDANVHLCFKANHDMEKSARREGRIGETRFLRIDVEMLRVQGVMGCPMVANRNDAVGQIKPIEEALEVIDLDVLYGAFADFKDPSNNERRARFNSSKMSEVLIPGAIAISLIYDLH